MLVCLLSGVLLCGAGRASATPAPAVAVAEEGAVEIHCAWLPKKPSDGEWSEPGSRIVLPGGVLLRDETIVSAGEWVLVDGKKQSVRVRRERFVRYLTSEGLSAVQPSSANALKKCALFVGTGETAFFVDMSDGSLCCVELKPKPPTSTPEQARVREAAKIAAGAAMLPGASVSVQRLPKAASKGARTRPDRDIVTDRGSLLTDDLPDAPEWTVVDAKQARTLIPRGRFVRYLTAQGLSDTLPAAADEVKRSVVLVGVADVAVVLDIEQGTAARVEVKRH